MSVKRVFKGREGFAVSIDQTNILESNKLNLQNLIDILNSKPCIIENEKNNYSADKLMMLLDNEKLTALEEEFDQHPNGIEMPNFIMLMKSAIQHPLQDKYELVNGLINLFQDIDINGDRHMEWSEFTQFIIDAVIGNQNTKFFDARLEKERELNENEILDNAYSTKTKRYVASSIIDSSIHQSIIKKLFYYDHDDELIVLEQNQRRLKFYNCKTNKLQVLQSNEYENNRKNRFKEIEPPPNESNTKNFVLDFCYATDINVIGLITSDKYHYFWENNKQMKLVQEFKTVELAIGIWWLSKSGLWATAGEGIDCYNIKIYQLENHNTSRKELFVLKAHMEQITELVEINQPRLLASSSLDGIIRLWDLQEKTAKSDLIEDKPDNKGIKGLAYNEEYGGNMISFGFENYLNVWCPEISLTRAYIGKLEGHSSIVVACKFITDSPNLVTIDDKTNIRVWDIRILQTVQVIASEFGTLLVNDIAIISRHDKFVLGGKRLQYYENNTSSKGMKNIQDEVFPLSIDFNNYFNCFVVLSKLDIRLYDALTGKLKKVFNFLFHQKFSAELMSFDLGARQRKVFVSENSGLVKQYNLKDGTLLKTVNSLTELDGIEFGNKCEHIKRKECNDIYSVKYLSEDKLLLVASSDSTIRMYDENDADSSELIKVLSGGHNESEILSLEVSLNMGIIGSGSANGLLSVWSLQSGQLYTTIQAHNQEITAIKFLLNHPIIITASLDGSIAIYSIKLSNRQCELDFMFRLLNNHIQKQQEINLSITQMIVISQSIDKFTVLKKQDTNIQKSYSVNQLIRNSSLKDQIQTVFQSRIDPQSVIIKNKYDQLIQFYKNQYPDENMNNVYLPEKMDYVYTHLEGMSETKKKNKEKQILTYIIFGDAKGNLTQLNLTELLNIHKIQKIDPDKQKEHGFQLRRKDLINGTKLVEEYLKKNKFDFDSRSVKMSNSVVLNRWSAHSQLITVVNTISNPLSLVTGSQDKQIKVWNYDGLLYGNIHMTKINCNRWNFPFDWVSIKLKEIDQVFDTLEIFDKETLDKEQKDSIKYDYLKNKYFHGEYKLSNFSQKYQKIKLAQSEHQKMLQHNESKKHKINLKQIDKLFENLMDNEYLKDIEKENQKFTSQVQKNLTADQYKTKIEMKKEIKCSQTIQMKTHLSNFDITKKFDYELIKKKNINKRVKQEIQEESKKKKVLMKEEDPANKKNKQKNNQQSVQQMNQTHSLSFKINQSDVLEMERLPKLEKLDTNKEKDSQIIDASSTQMSSSFNKPNKLISLNKHKQFVKSLVSRIPKQIKPKLDPSFKDIRYKDGEGTIVLKKACLNQRNYFYSNSQKMLCDSNYVLQQQMNYYNNKVQQIDVPSKTDVEYLLDKRVKISQKKNKDNKEKK